MAVARGRAVDGGTCHSPCNGDGGSSGCGWAVAGTATTLAAAAGRIVGLLRTPHDDDDDDANGDEGGGLALEDGVFPGPLAFVDVAVDRGADGVRAEVSLLARAFIASTATAAAARRAASARGMVLALPPAVAPRRSGGDGSGGGDGGGDGDGGCDGGRLSAVEGRFVAVVDVASLGRDADAD
jgi:hypothetical protein